MHLTRADQRVLLACLLVSVLLHAWLLSGVAIDGGAVSRRAFDASPTIRLAIDPVMPQSPLALSDATPSEPARVRSDPPKRLEELAPQPPKREASDSVRATKSAAQSPARAVESDIRDPRPEAPAIATAEQYRFALVMQARREREGSGPGRALEGRTRVRLEFGDHGALQSTKVVASSGQELLDVEALRLFDQAHQKLPVPRALLAKPFAIEATVSFERD